MRTSMEELGTMDETDFYEAAGTVADYFKDVEGQAKNDILSSLFAQLKGYGFPTGDGYDADGSVQLYFTVTQEAKENYFRPRFEKAKQILSSMTLKEFATDVTELGFAVENRYGDAVMADGSFQVDGSFHTFDSFIRDAVCGTKYYVGNVVLMH